MTPTHSDTGKRLEMKKSELKIQVDEEIKKDILPKNVDSQYLKEFNHSEREEVPFTFKHQTTKHAEKKTGYFEL